MGEDVVEILERLTPSREQELAAARYKEAFLKSLTHEELVKLMGEDALALGSCEAHRKPELAPAK